LPFYSIEIIKIMSNAHAELNVFFTFSFFAYLAYRNLFAKAAENFVNGWDKSRL